MHSRTHIYTRCVNLNACYTETRIGTEYIIENYLCHTSHKYTLTFFEHRRKIQKFIPFRRRNVERELQGMRSGTGKRDTEHIT